LTPEARGLTPLSNPLESALDRAAPRFRQPADRVATEPQSAEIVAAASSQLHLAGATIL